ncbi:MAG: hypothetical protein J0H40_19530 [Rhizobiales bacterium]|nr:hypothetical protein [Hyphomicrobiales bacterium]
MTALDPEAGAWCVDERSRKVTRPALTTLMMILLGVMIAIDVWRRRRNAAG